MKNEISQMSQNNKNMVEDIRVLKIIVDENKEKMVDMENTLQENKENLKKIISLGLKFLIENKEMIETHKQMQKEISALKATLSETKETIEGNKKIKGDYLEKIDEEIFKIKNTVNTNKETIERIETSGKIDGNKITEIDKKVISSAGFA